MSAGIYRDVSELCRLAGAPAQNISLVAGCVRDREVGAIWRPLNRANPNVMPCWGCAGDYIYQFKPCTVDSIQRGRWRWDLGETEVGLCDAHYHRFDADRKKRGY